MPKRKAALNLDLLNERALGEFTPTSINQLESKEQKLLELDAILDRPGGNTRALNHNHVEALADSISVLGLITPLTVDRNGYLLAGGHRRESLQLLAIEQPERFEELFSDGIPVRVMDVDSSTDEIDALQIEVEENTQRRNFTPAEIREAAKRLEQAGYERLRGRPRKGQKSLKRALANVFRLSEDRIQRILNNADEKGRRTPTFSPEKAVQTLEGWISAIDSSSSEFKSVAKQMNVLLKDLKQLT